MILGEAVVGFIEGVGLQADVDVALEGLGGDLGVVRSERGLPLSEARRVESGDLVADAHQLRDAGRAVVAQDVDQLAGAVEVVGLAVDIGGGRGLEVQRLGRRDHAEHGRAPDVR